MVICLGACILSNNSVGPFLVRFLIQVDVSAHQPKMKSNCLMSVL